MRVSASTQPAASPARSTLQPATPLCYSSRLQVPDIYDAAKHALLHNAQLPIPHAPPQPLTAAAGEAAGGGSSPAGGDGPARLFGELLAPVYLAARELADVVVPHEYGCSPQVQHMPVGILVGVLVGFLWDYIPVGALTAGRSRCTE